MSREVGTLFSGSMVRANHAGLKDVTRRLMNPQPVFAQIHKWKGTLIYEGEARQWCWKDKTLGNIWDFPAERAPLNEAARWAPGDVIWSRESLIRPDGDPWLYAADRQAVVVAKEDETAMLVWAHHKQQSYCPSIHMPRWACRDTYTVLSVRAERLQDITEEDAIREGVVKEWNWKDERWMFTSHAGSSTCPIEAFADLIDSINGHGTWERNDWVWRVEYNNPVKAGRP